MKQILSYRPDTLNAWQQTSARTSIIYLIEESDINKPLPNLMGYKQHLVIRKDHVGKYCEITTFDHDKYQNSQIVSEEWISNVQKKTTNAIQGTTTT